MRLYRVPVRFRRSWAILPGLNHRTATPGSTRQAWACPFPLLRIRQATRQPIPQVRSPTRRAPIPSTPSRPRTQRTRHLRHRRRGLLALRRQASNVAGFAAAAKGRSRPLAGSLDASGIGLAPLWQVERRETLTRTCRKLAQDSCDLADGLDYRHAEHRSRHQQGPVERSRKPTEMHAPAAATPGRRAVERSRKPTEMHARQH